MTGNFETFFDQLLEGAEEEAVSVGGVNIIGKTHFYTAYKTFESGIPLHQAFHVVENLNDRDAARERASEQSKAGAGNRVTYGLLMIVEKDSAIKRDGEPVTWNMDRHLFVPFSKIAGEWTAATDMVFEIIKELQLTLPSAHWAHIGWRQDPYVGEDGKRNMTDWTDQNTGETEERVKTYAVPFAIFTTEAEAKDGFGSFADVAGQGQTNAPPGWDANNWNNMKPKIKVLLGEGKTVEEVADMYGVDAKYLQDL